MKKIENNARIQGVGIIALAESKLTVHQAINARTYTTGLPTRYIREKKGHEHMRSFISLCKVPEQYTSEPNQTGWQQPNVF